MSGIALLIDTILRGLVLAVFLAAAVVALTHWLVREGHLAPFSAWARGIRRLSDPVLQPLERLLVRQGRNPQEGPFWLVAIVVVAGIVVISLGRWLIGAVAATAAVARGGPLGWLRLLLDLGFNLLLLAIVVRVIGSWLGASRYRRWMRPVYGATDWLVEPIQRMLPPVGLIDLSPLVAYVVVLLARWLVFAVV